MSSPSKNFKALIKELRAQGWTVEQGGSGPTHYQAKPPDPDGQIVHFGKSNDPRAFDNTVSNLRKSGFEWPPPPRSRRDPGAPLSDPALEAPEPEPSRPSSEEDMDDLWERLKEARGYCQLAEEQRVERERDVEAARAALKDAESSLRKAEAEVKAANGRFQEAKADLDRAILPEVMREAS